MITAEIPILQQMYANKGRASVGEPTSIKAPTQYRMHFLLPMALGILLCSVPFASILTLYLNKNQCCSTQSTASTSTTTTSTSTTTTSTSTTTTTTTTTTSTTTSTTQTTAVITQTYVCSGRSSHTLWQLYNTNGITMSIDTSNCTFTATPVYFTSMAGISSHWILTSYTAIYSPTPSSFRVYTRAMNGWNSTEMFDYAQLYLWDINWVGMLI